jgi:hypothetical protein
MQTRILSDPHSVASYDKQRDAEDLWHGTSVFPVSSDLI